MRPEISQSGVTLRTPTGEPFTIEDVQDREIFPVRDLNAALELPSMLPIHRSMAEASHTLMEEELRIAGYLISGAYYQASAIGNYVRSGGSKFITKQREARRQFLTELAEDEADRRRKFGVLHEGIKRLAPAEIEFWTEKLTNAQAQEEILDDDYIAAGEADKSFFLSRVARKETGRLAETTEENQQELAIVSDTYNKVLLLDNHANTAETLDFCAVFGDRRQVSVAIAALERLRTIACDPEDHSLQKVVKQANVARSAHKLAAEIYNQNADQLEPGIRQTLLAHLKELASVTQLNIIRSETLHFLLRGRDFRLNGNAHPEPVIEVVAAPSDEQPKPDEQTAEPEAEAAPSALPSYLEDLEPLLEQAGGVAQPKLLPAKEIKRRGLDEARAVLVKGENDKDGNVIISGRPKAEAQQDISNIEFIRSFIAQAGNLAQAREAIEQAAEDCDQYLTDIKAFLGEAGDNLTAAELSRLRDSAPAVGSLQDLLGIMRQEWPATEHLLRNYWPDGKQAAEQLHNLLFMTSQELAAQLKEEQAAPEPEIDEPVELPVDEVIEVNPLEAHSELAAIAKQLDQVILPPHATHDDVKRIIEASGLSTEQAEQIDWTRLYNLVTLREQNDGTMYRSKDGDLGNAPPYFVVTIDFKGDTYAVAESPVEGNATYVISEKDCPGTWLEVLQLDKASARELGARRVIHRAGKATPDHLAKIQDVLIDLAISQAA